MRRTSSASPRNSASRSAATSARTRQPSTVRLSLIPPPFPTSQRGRRPPYPSLPASPLVSPLPPTNPRRRNPKILVRGESASALTAPRNRPVVAAANRAVCSQRGPDALGISAHREGAASHRPTRTARSLSTTLSLARIAESRLEPTPHPLRPSGGLCGRPFSRAASGAASNRSIVDTHRHRSRRVERATDRRSDTRSRLDQLAPAIVPRQPLASGRMIHAVQADRHPDGG